MTGATLRDRKKRDTYRALAEAARQMVASRGLDQVTVEEIAEAAGVSPRTFFNYFSCKEEALVGMEPGFLAELADELRARHPDEAPLAALRAVLGIDADPGATQRRWQVRNELVARYPALVPRHLAALAQVEVVLAGALADRLGLDAARDPGPRLQVAAALAAIRSGLDWWEASDRSHPLPEVFDRALATVVADPGPPPASASSVPAPNRPTTPTRATGEQP